MAASRKRPVPNGGSKMEIEYKSANQRIISDPYNPRIFVVEWKCAGCGEWLNEDEVLWIDPETGEATQ